eukprot:3026584-Pyramimonas_sp.AAC.1
MRAQPQDNPARARSEGGPWREQRMLAARGAPSSPRAYPSLGPTSSLTSRSPWPETGLAPGSPRISRRP